MGATPTTTGSSVAEHQPYGLEVAGSTPDPVDLPNYWRIRWHEKLGLPECPYVHRWYVQTPWFSIRLHHWTGSDDVRALHDHPWPFVTFVLSGHYLDVTEVDGQWFTSECRQWHLYYRPALHTHAVVPNGSQPWTLLLTGPVVRRWGFWVNYRGRFRWMRSVKYFGVFKPHPCE